MTLFLNSLKKYYKIINITFIILSVYLITFPISSHFLEMLSPNLTKCVYKEMTGNDCPLCGGTRFFNNILENGFLFDYLFSPFGFMFIVVIIELVSRIILLFLSKKITTKIIIIDLIWHSLIFTGYIIYLITFFIF